MPDVLTPEQRRRCMSAIKSKDTKPELILRRLLWQEGFRYRLKSLLPGRPDVVFPSAKLVVFIDGCFWHGCPKHCALPRTRTHFWHEKIERNRLRDQVVAKQLGNLRWRLIRIWEHDIEKSPEKAVARIRKALHQATILSGKP